MANVYDKVYDNQPVSNYVPLPTDLISKVLSSKQEGYNTVLDQANKVEDEVLKVNAIDEHQPIKNQLINSYKNKVEGIADDIMKTGDTSKVRELNRIASQWRNDPIRNELETSFSNKQLEQKKKIELGDKYALWGDPNLGYKGITDNGNIQPFRFNGLHEQQDHQKKAEDMMNGFKPSGYETEGFNLDPDTGNITSIKQGKEGVAKQVIQDASIKKSPDFINTVEGQDWARKFAHFNPNASQQDLLIGASKYLYNAGLNSISEKTTSSKEFKLGPKDLRDKQDINQTTSTQSEGLPGSLIKIPDEIKDLKFKDGQVVPLLKDQYHNTDESPYMTKDSIGTKSGKVATGEKVFDEESNKKVVDFINTFKKEHPELEGLNNEQLINTYKQGVKSLESESIPLESISNVAAKNIGESLARNLDQRNIYLYDSKGKTTTGTKDEVLKQLGITQEELEKQIKSGISGYTQAGPSAGSYYTSIKDDHENSRRIMISPDEEMKKIFRTSQAVNEARKTLTSKEVKPFEDIPNYSIVVKPEFKKNGVLDWKYIEVIKDKNGNVVKSNETSLEEIRKAEKEHLRKSNYLGSQTEILKENTTE